MDYEVYWRKLKEKIEDNSDCCAQAQLCVAIDGVYEDATARMEAYNHVLDMMKEIENVNSL